MNTNDITKQVYRDIIEQAYRNGYEAGLSEGKPKWTPVTERLPDKSMGNCSKDVLVDDGGVILIGWYDYATREWRAYEYFNFERVNAWMPIPEPSKEETP